MAKKLLTNKRKAFVPVSTLQKTALVMLHFYHAIAKHPTYAEAWSKAVATADLNKMQALLGMITKQAKRLPLGSNGIGYFITFPSTGSKSDLTSGTSIIPGSTQFYFEINVHRSIARAVIPFYAALAYNRQFSVAFAKAVGAGDVKIVSKMVRTLIRSKSLVRMDAGYDEGGIALSFKYKNSKYKYRQLLFIEAL